MAKLSMTKPMVLASLIILSAYTPGALAAQDARACQKQCVEKMQQPREVAYAEYGDVQ